MISSFVAKKNGRILLRLILVTGLLLAALAGVIYLTGKTGIRTATPVLKKEKSFGIIVPDGYKIHGIDISSHQSVIDWARVDSMKDHGKEISFVFVRATEGITRQDPLFDRNWKALKKTGMIRGTYHFYYPSRDASKQAANFIRQVKLEKGDLPPVVDIEHANGKSRKSICKGLRTFLVKLEAQYRVKPIIYTNHSFYNDYLSGSFDDYKLWISYYNGQDGFRNACTYDWQFWQHSDKGKVDGIAGNVDFNVFNGTADELKKMCLQ